MSVRFEGDFFKKLKRVHRPSFFRNTTSKAGVVAETFFKERFRQKNWVDRSREPWEPRKRKSNVGSILVKSSRLKKSIRKINQGNFYVTIGTDVPYAQIHNEKGKITGTAQVRTHKRTFKSRKRTKTVQVKSHERTMNTTIPQRQFMGESALLARRLERLLFNEVNKQLKR